MRTPTHIAGRLALCGAAAVLAACAAAPAAPPPCDLAAFGSAPATPAHLGCARGSAGCVPPFLPAEAQAVERGAVHETLGLGPNDGRATWRVLDVGRGQLVVVERYAGARLAAAPKVTTSPHEFLRRQGPAGGEQVDHVRRWPLAAGELGRLACAIEPAWRSTVSLSARRDVGQRLYLVGPAQIKTQGGPGQLEGAPQAWQADMDAVAGSRAPGRSGAH